MKKIIAALALSVILIPAVSLAAFNQNLSYGTSGQQVTDLQNFLAKENLYTGPITGNFFGLTKNAVIAFQKANDIQPASGFFGTATRAAVDKIENSHASAPTAQMTPSATTTPSTETSTNSTASSSTQTPLAPPTAAELAGAQTMCAIPTVSQYCNTDFWNAYDTNITARDAVDYEVAKYNQAETTITQQQQTKQTQEESCYNNFLQVDASILQGMGGNAYQAEENMRAVCYGQPSPDQTSSQLSQLQTQMQSLTTSNQQLQQQIQQQTENQQFAQQQAQEQAQQQQILNQETAKHCGWDAGVYDCNLP